MKRINLEKLTILNFKGIEKMVVEFSDITDVFGKNESGKTSIWDAFNWLITGKESNNSERFPIKRLDKNGEAIQNIDVSVEGKFIITDSETAEVQELLIKREFVEMWGAEKRGSSNIVFKGNTNKYYWNNSPLETETDYNSRISAAFGSDQTFKILTNPAFFSSDSFDWENRRSILEDLAGGELTDDVILMENPNLEGLISVLKNKSLKDIKSESSHNKKLLKDEQSKIKTRIEEAKLSKVDPVDEDSINQKIDEAHKELAVIDDKLSSISKRQEAANKNRTDAQQKIWAIEAENAKIHNDANIAFSHDSINSNSVLSNLESLKSEKLSKIKDTESRIVDGAEYIDRLDSSHESEKKNIQNQIDLCKTEMVQLRESFSDLSKETFVFNDDDTVCQLCQRPHDEGVLSDHKEKAVKAFNLKIVEKKKKINDRGSELKNMVSDLENKVSALNDGHSAKRASYSDRIVELRSVLEKLKVELSEIEALIDLEKSGNKPVIKTVEERLTPEYHENLVKINDLKESLSNMVSNTDQPDESSVNRKKELINLISDLKVELLANVNNKKVEERISDLKNQFTEIGIKLSENDKIAFDADEYERYKFEELERRVNLRFKLVNFKMFNRLQNGGFEPTCLVTYKGVPYVNGGLNTASRMIAGIDIIQTLSDHFNVKLPLFLDNRESCSVIPETDLQIVNFFVSADDEKIRVVQS